MPGKSLAQLVAGARTLGLGLTLQALLYPLRRRYYEARFSAPGRDSVLRGLAGILTVAQAVRAELPPGRDSHRSAT